MLGRGLGVHGAQLEGLCDCRRCVQLHPFLDQDWHFAGGLKLCRQNTLTLHRSVPGRKLTEGEAEFGLVELAGPRTAIPSKNGMRTKGSLEGFRVQGSGFRV